MAAQDVGDADAERADEIRHDEAPTVASPRLIEQVTVACALARRRVLRHDDTGP